MNLVFCGTPEFAVPTLEELAHNFTVKLVVAQPDRPSGRGMEVIAPAVKRLAQRLEIPVAQPERIKDNHEFRAQLRAIKPDVIVVVAYGRIIPQWMIDLAPLGNINLHASLLPKYRGAAPVQWAIANGESLTGVTSMRIDVGLDTGPMMLRREVEIDPNETSLTLAPRLAATGAELMTETLAGLESGTITPQPQDDSQATLAPLLKKQDGLIDFRRSAREIYNRFRAFQPWPGAYTSFRGKNVKAIAMQPATGNAALSTGEILFQNNQLLAGCGQGSVVEFLELQPESRKPVLAAEFARGTRIQSGERFGS